MVFGGIERERKKNIVLLTNGQKVLQRKKETLIPIIKKYIKPGSVIYSDKWGAYSTLSNHGYTHYQINHSANFVDPQDCSIHTQNIESLWRCFKKHSKRPEMKQHTWSSMCHASYFCKILSKKTDFIIF